MAMTSRLWSISALAVELGLDRRTVAARLRTVAPDGTLKNSPAWLLPTAVRALRPDGRGASRGGDAFATARINPFLSGITLGHNVTLLGVPQAVAEAAVAAGLSMDQAHALAEDAVRAVMRVCRRYL